MIGIPFTFLKLSSVFHFSGNCTCPPTIINLNLPKKIEEAKVMFTTMNFAAHVKHSFCNISARGTWHISRAPLKRRSFLFFVKNAVKQNRQVLSMRRANSSNIYYYVSYLLRIPQEDKIIGYDYGYVLLLKPSAVARISGVSIATKGDGNITLNGSSSHGSGPHPLNFTWFCRRESERFPVDESLPVVDTARGLSGGCYGYGPGRLGSTKSILVVVVDKMKEDHTYWFKLVVSNGLKSSRAFHELRIQAFKSTFFKIR